MVGNNVTSPNEVSLLIFIRSEDVLVKYQLGRVSRVNQAGGELAGCSLCNNHIAEREAGGCLLKLLVSLEKG